MTLMRVSKSSSEIRKARCAETFKSGPPPSAAAKPVTGAKKGGVLKRAIFIIDRSGIIQYAKSDDDARALPNFEKVKARLGELK